MAEVGESGFIERFVSLAERDGERVFARFEGEALSFAHLHDQSARIAAGLRRLGVGRGDRVAVMLANSPAALALLFALAKSGAVWVPLNVQLRADGLRYILDHAEPRMVIARADLIPLIRGCGATLPQATLIAEGEVDGVLTLASLGAGPAGLDAEPPAARRASTRGCRGPRRCLRSATPRARPARRRAS